MGHKVTDYKTCSIYTRRRAATSCRFVQFVVWSRTTSCGAVQLEQVDLLQVKWDTSGTSDTDVFCRLSFSADLRSHWDHLNWESRTKYVNTCTPIL